MKKQIIVIVILNLLLSIFGNSLLSVVYADNDVETSPIEVVRKENLKDDPEIKKRFEGLVYLETRLIRLQTIEGKDIFCLDETKTYPDGNQIYSIGEILKDPRIAWIIQNYDKQQASKFEYVATQLVIWRLVHSDNYWLGYIVDKNPEMKKLFDEAKKHEKDPLPHERIESYTVSLSPNDTELIEKDSVYESTFEVKVCDENGDVNEEVDLNGEKYTIDTKPKGYEKYIKKEELGKNIRIYIDKKDVKNIPDNLEIKLSLSTILKAKIMASMSYFPDNNRQPVGIYKAVTLLSKKTLGASATATATKIKEKTEVKGTK
ncbi:TPA: thioester domain-containing protein, partial [Bacillus cereus]